MSRAQPPTLDYGAPFYAVLASCLLAAVACTGGKSTADGAGVSVGGGGSAGMASAGAGAGGMMASGASAGNAATETGGAATAGAAGGGSGMGGGGSAGVAGDSGGVGGASGSAAGGAAGSGNGGASGSGGALPAPSTFDNPIIKYDAQDPTNGPGNAIFTADGAALVWKNRVYLYTGHDEQVQGTNAYRMFDYRLWQSVDMVHWENKGAVARYSVFGWATGNDTTGNANAAQVVERDDADGKPKFYFYAPLQGGQSDYGISIGVAVAENPEGPFTDARGIPLIYLADTANTAATHSWRNLDPTVFVDDDGRAYMYWGNGILYWVELESDMIHLKGETYTTDSGGKMQNRSFSGVALHIISNLSTYTEAPWLSKHGGTYYLSYAAGFPETIAYATSTSPSGPWQDRGTLVDRVQNSDTVHQSLFDFQGASYVSYHNGALPTGGSYRRSTCMDRAYYNSDGTLKKVVQTHL